MKNTNRQPPKAAAKPQLWHYALALFAFLFLTFEVYQPALNGPFIFDDAYLPFTQPEYQNAPLRGWVNNLRPVLMFSYWLNLRLSGLEPYSYHAFNIFFHLLNGLWVFLLSRRMLERVAQGNPSNLILATFAGAVFLLHPVQTESVAYVASRSEVLSVLFFHAGFVLFLTRQQKGLTFPSALGVLTLFGIASLTKEHAAVFPALLLFTDWFWGGYSFAAIRRNWRLYVPATIVGAGALAFVFRVLRSADTAGFGMKDLPWHDYFYTQCRAIWVYIRLFFLPVGQNFDYDFAISRSLLDHGAIFGLIGLLALAAAAFVYKERFPLASYGVFVFLILLAPTSSFVPIRDVLVERRLYLPFIGLLFVSLEFLSRWKTSRTALIGTLAGVLAVLSFLTYSRNHLFGDPIALWTDTIERSPNKARPHFQLGFAHYERQRCDEAVKYYDKAAALEPPEEKLLIDWALAYDCLSRPGDALGKLHQAAAKKETAHIYSLIGMIHGKQGHREQALEALAKAESLNRRWDMTYAYRGNVYTASGELDEAEKEFRRALALDPSNPVATQGLAALRRMRSGRR